MSKHLTIVLEFDDKAELPSVMGINQLLGGQVVAFSHCNVIEEERRKEMDPDMHGIHGTWRCYECGDYPGSPGSDLARWRWVGNQWEHHHGYPVGHMPSRYFRFNNEDMPQ